VGDPLPVTWRQLAGDPRLSGALAECDARGWDALPLAPRALARLLPELWGSEKAAERWLAKNPPESIVNLAARGMLVVSVARRLGSEGPLLAYCVAPL
jgi:hypothetical protein